MRLFTAISLSEKFIEEFTQTRSSSNIRNYIRWTKPENLHITTCFIGETEKNEVDRIIGKIKSISEVTPIFDLEFRNIQLAPPKKKPYMIWVNYTSNDTYTDLCDKLNFELINLSKRTYYPHVTLARFKGFLKLHSSQLRFNFPSLEITNIGLLKSELTKSEPIYEKLEDFPLKG